MASTFDKPACTPLVQHAPRTAPATSSIVNNTVSGPTAHKTNPLQSCVPRTQQHNESPTTSSKQTMAINFKPLESAPTSADVALTSRPTYNYYILYVIAMTVVHTSFCLFDIGAGIIVIRSEMIQKGWLNRIATGGPPLSSGIIEAATYARRISSLTPSP